MARRSSPGDGGGGSVALGAPAPLSTGPTDGALAWQDFADALRQYWFWMTLAWLDIVQRYRGSLLGPFWLTLTTGAFIAGLGPLYAALFGLDPREYLPFMAVGFIVWNFLVTTINESCRAFIDAAPVMKQVRMPKSGLILRIIWRNVLVLAHHLPIVILVAVYGGASIGWNTLLVVPGALLLGFNMIWVGLVLAITCARYRDVIQIIASILALAFFVTPIIWNPAMQRVPDWLVNLNPFAAYIELIRAPILNQPVAAPLLIHALVLSVLLTLLGGLVFRRYRRDIVYWV